MSYHGVYACLALCEKGYSARDCRGAPMGKICDHILAQNYQCHADVQNARHFFTWCAVEVISELHHFHHWARNADTVYGQHANHRRWKRMQRLIGLPIPSATRLESYRMITLWINLCIRRRHPESLRLPKTFNDIQNAARNVGTSVTKSCLNQWATGPGGATKDDGKT